MRFSGSFCALTFGLGLLLGGCAGDAADATEGDEATASPHASGLILDPTGTGSTNGLPPPEFHPNALALLMATKEPLFTVAPVVDLEGNTPSPLGLTVKVNPAVASLFTTPAARHTFKYAMQCALPTGTVALLHGEKYPGGGVLSNASSWMTGKLDEDPQSDLFACMAAHLNMVGAEIDLRLTGGPIPNQLDEGQTSEFGAQEAYWQSDRPAGSFTVIYRVWPLPDLEGFCGGSITSDSLNLRVCGTVNGGCGLDVRTNLAAECTEGPTGPTCMGRPVLKTWLRAKDLPVMHPRCVRRPKGPN